MSSTVHRTSSYRRTRSGVLVGRVLVVLAAALALSWYAVDSRGATNLRRPTVPSTTLVHRAPGPQREQPGWSAITRQHGVIVADRRAFVQADGNVITVYRFRVGRVRFALHAGSEDPPGVAAAVGPGAGQRISASESPAIVAAFNGGFKVASGSGGFELGRRAFVPLHVGLASLVINSSGVADVGVWGADLPYKGEHVVSVRQNLQPLVMASRLSPVINDLAAWGSSLAGAPAVARSALGEGANGDIMFAASMRALPIDLGTALIDAGAVRAMQLDINPEWVQLESTPHPGGVMVAGIPYQNRPSDQYSVGWTRDFVTVTARS